MRIGIFARPEWISNPNSIERQNWINRDSFPSHTWLINLSLYYELSEIYMLADFIDAQCSATIPINIVLAIPKHDAFYEFPESELCFCLIWITILKEFPIKTVHSIHSSAGRRIFVGVIELAAFRMWMKPDTVHRIIYMDTPIDVSGQYSRARDGIQ